MTEKQLKKELSSLDKSVLLEIILDLFKTNKSVQEQLEYYIKPDIQKVLSDYKKKMKKIYSPPRDSVIKTSDPQKLISEFRRLDPPSDVLIDFLLFSIEEGISYIDYYIDERYRFYEELGSILEHATAIIEGENLDEKYQERVNSIIDQSESTSIQLSDILRDYYIFLDTDTEIE